MNCLMGLVNLGSSERCQLLHMHTPHTHIDTCMYIIINIQKHITIQIIHTYTHTHYISIIMHIPGAYTEPSVGGFTISSW